MQASSFPAPASFKTQLLILLCLAWVIPGLIGHDPWKPDEAYSFGLVNHILNSGDWVVPTLAGEPFMEKPPLYYITAAAFARLFSGWLPLHDGARLASGFYMALTLLFTGMAGRELWGVGQGRISVLILIGCLGLLVHAHALITDIALLTGFAVAFYGLALCTRRALVGGFLIGTGAGIGFMSKGLIGPGMIGLISLLLPVFFKSWRSKSYVLCLLVALIAALPWAIIWPWALYQRSPELFREWFWIENWGRFLGFAQRGPGSERGFYLETLPWFAWPALPLAAWALWRGRLEGLKQPAVQLPLLAFIVMLAVLSAASDARDIYALPLLLPLTLLAAKGVDTLRRGAASALDWFGMTTFGLISALLWLGWFAMLTGRPEQLAANLARLQPGFAASLQVPPFLLALLVTSLWIIAVAGLKRSNRRAIVNWALGLTMMWVLLATLWLPWIDAGKSYRSMIAEMQQAMPASYRCVASQSLGEPQRALLEYFAGIVTKRLEVNPKAKCDLLLLQGSAGEKADPGRQWRKIWEGARPGDNKERFHLFQLANKTAKQG